METPFLTGKELAEVLAISYSTLKKTWRGLPHIKLGSGNSLNSVRFLLPDVISYLRMLNYGPKEILDQTRHQIRGQVHGQGPDDIEAWLSDSSGGESLDSGCEEDETETENRRKRLLRLVQ